MRTFFLCVCLLGTYANANLIISAHDARILSPLFQLLLEQSEMGYVLQNKKPVCGICYSVHPLFFDKIEEYQLDIAICLGKKALDNPAFQTNNVFFFFDEKEKMLLIINRKLFVNTVNENLPLFQYVLGPTITPENILSSLQSQELSFFELLKYDRVLIGIVLGYGTQNALWKSRKENIAYDGMPAQDEPPFRSNTVFCTDAFVKEELLFCKAKRNVKWSKERCFLNPTYGFSSLHEEEKAIEEKMSTSSQKLRENLPTFIFACLKEERELLHELETTQEKIQTILSSPHAFDTVLKMICGESVIVETNADDILIGHIKNINLLLAKLFRQELKEYHPSFLPCFVEGLLGKVSDDNHGGDFTAVPDALNNIKIAKLNLDAADLFFKSLQIDHSFTAVLPHHLYYQVIEKGMGDALAHETEVCIDYEIIDPAGRCLKWDREAEIHLEETIPGFAHGMKGMRKGERRVIYIHPAVAYGVHTYLEKGIYLKALVTLHDMHPSEGCLPELIPMDLSFVQSEAFQKKCEEEHRQSLRYRGAQKRAALKARPEVDIDEIAQALQSMHEPTALTNEESYELNQMFWNLYFIP